jgi:hypothetical protein
MSSGLSCELIEPKPGQWFYLLENYFTPKGAWDWREHDPNVHGPFKDKDAAYEHLGRNYANPGGSEIVDHASFKMTPLYEKLIAGATR